ncbi:MAG: acetate--CoA ligase family protein [Deltaproteobacteria bacterium]|nr:acetate--CoA ligase family protein [Deltaproteobacteria bacterium]
MRGFFKPESIAVVGVSPRETNLGRRILMNLHKYGFSGVIYPVGRSGGSFQGHLIYPSLTHIGRPVDLAVVLTPAVTVPDVLRECGELGIRRVIVESGGFAELGQDGLVLSAKALAIAEEYGIRFMGPNGIGTADVHSGLCVPFAEMAKPRPGGVSIVTQSGGVGMQLMMQFEAEAVGVAKFASIGNKLNVDEVDLLEFLIDDPETSQLVFYLESFSRGEEFCRLVASSDKPVIVHKSNTSRMSSSIAASHTTAMLSDDRVVDAALAQCGALRTRTMRSAVDAAKIFSIPPMKGRRVGVISRSGGNAVIAADVCAERGFALPNFDKHVLDLAARHVRAGVIKLQNPLDLGDVFDMDTYKKVLSDIVRQPQIDGIVFLLTYSSTQDPAAADSLVDHIEQIAAKHEKPIVLVLQTWPHETARMKQRSPFPIFETAEEGVEALYVSYRGETHRKQRRARVPKVSAKPETARRLVEAAIGLPHLGAKAFDVLDAYEIVRVPGQVATSKAEAVRLAESADYPVVMKIESAFAVHKTELSGVKIGLKNAAEVKAAFDEIKNNLFKAGYRPSEFEGVLVQPMADRGLELIVGASRDRDFGPLVILGWGGIVAEALGPPIIRMAPITKRDAMGMIDQLPARGILNGIRGNPPYDVDALADVLVRTARLIADQEAIAEMDLNPVRLYAKGKGALALDARIIPRKESLSKKS